MDQPPLKPLHNELLQIKLDALSKIPTDEIKRSLLPGMPHSLKTRPDGTMLDGHHRIRVLQSRGEDVDRLPRELVQKTLAE